MCIEKICRDTYRMGQIKRSLCANWQTLSRDTYLWITCKKLVEEENRTGDFHQEILCRTTHVPLTNCKENLKPSVIVQLKYVNAADFYGTIDRFCGIMRRTPNGERRYNRFTENPLSEEAFTNSDASRACRNQN